MATRESDVTQPLATGSASPSNDAPGPGNNRYRLSNRERRRRHRWWLLALLLAIVVGIVTYALAQNRGGDSSTAFALVTLVGSGRRPWRSIRLSGSDRLRQQKATFS